MELRFLHFYPELMNLYGSWANIALLKRHLEALGNTVTVERVHPGNPVENFDEVDFIYMGAGTERSQKAAQADFTRFGKEMRDAAEDGVPMLFCGTAMQLLGQSITDVNGKYYMGVKVGSFSSVQGRRRFVGDVYGFTDLYQSPIVGFMNSCSQITGVTTPLITRMSMGYGNEAERGPEGFHKNNVFASELTGPILVKNPPLMRKIITAIYEHYNQVVGEDEPIEAPDPATEEAPPPPLEPKTAEPETPKKDAMTDLLLASMERAKARQGSVEKAIPKEAPPTAQKEETPWWPRKPQKTEEPKKEKPVLHREELPAELPTYPLEEEMYKTACKRLKELVSL